jgi:hypothetical protein
MHARIDLIAESFRAGAKGYIVKESAAPRLLQALEAVARGEQYLDSSLAPKVLVKLDEYAARRAGSTDPAYGSLTRREQQILRLLAEGRGAADIAAMCSSPARPWRTIAPTSWASGPREPGCARALRRPPGPRRLDAATGYPGKAGSEAVRPSMLSDPAAARHAERAGKK